jgi:hypothetical protein
MAPIKRRGPRGGLVSTRIPLNGINSVATNAANKRQPNEADQIDNALVSLERGVEKRPGFEIVPQYTIPGLSTWNWSSNDTRLDLFALPTSEDLFHYWYSINEDNTFLVVINFDATGATQKLFYIYQLITNAVTDEVTWKDLTPVAQWDPADIPATYTVGNANSQAVQDTVTSGAYATYAAARSAGCVNKDSRAYITYKTATKTAKDSLRAVSVGSNIMILNTNVCAGFSSDYTNNATYDGKLFNLDGTYPSVGSLVDDVEGRRITYYSAVKAMKVYDVGDDGLPGTTDDLLLGWKPGVITGLIHSNANIAATGTTSVIVTSSTNIPVSYLAAGQGSTITVSGRTFTISGATSTLTSGLYHYTLTVVGSSPALSITAGTAYSITIGGAAYIPVSDYFYFDSTKAYLGQRVDDISSIRLPPENDDWYSNNGNPTTSDTKAKQMLTSLYDVDTRYNGIINGFGKIYYVMNPYLNTTAGYYRVISFTEGNTTTVTGSSVTGYGRPYLQKVRTPDEHSYLDPRRMPQRLNVTISSNAVTAWSISKVKWTPRTTGDKRSNPGPTVFKTSDGSALRHPQIKAMAVFNNRLWFAADDVVFSTQVGAYENLFINDPSNIISTDPIDIRASSNQYAEISCMVPFDEYLFIDTKAKTQFQLTSASTSVLSPTNVAIAPVTFYSTATITQPMLIGTRLYFFGPNRLYLYAGKNSMGYSSAVEMSSSAAGYLPTNYRSICTAPAQDTIAMVSEENPHEIYFNTSRFSADRIIQNSFYRYVIDDKHDIQSIQSYKNYLYSVVKADYTTTTGGIYYILMRTKLLYEDVKVPRMDSMFKVKLITGSNVTYNSTTDETSFTLPPLGYTVNDTRFVLAYPWNTESDGDLSLTVLQDVDAGGVGLLPNLSFTVKGNYTPPEVDDENYLYVGVPFETRIQLSTMFVRDDNNNIIDGVLNIRSGVFRHFNTGDYDIEVTHRGRTALVSKFTAPKMDFTTNEDALPLEVAENQGEFVAKVFGYSDSTKIAIVSNYTTPMNITNMEFKGKFKQKYSSFN